MVQETMTVHKALAELKVLDSRLDSVIGAGVYCTANKRSSDKIQGVDVDKFISSMRSAHDSATDLIRREKAIKRAVTLSNATTEVTIGHKSYTVAEAIWMKNHGIEKDVMLLKRMKSQLAASTTLVEERNGQELEDRADKYVSEMYSGSDGKSISNEASVVRAEFIKSQSYVLIDPLDVRDKIDKLEAEILAFTSEVDAALSVSNAITTITIEY